MDLKDLRELTAPCGLDCFNCPFYLANDNEEIRKQIQSTISETGYNLSDQEAVCKGCRRENGMIPIRRTNGLELCKVYKCISSKDIESCADCSDFPCDNLQPWADLASMVPHNIKVYNLALIRKMGWEKWAQEKAKSVREAYFTHKFDI
ncbi:MAG TPA: DUF3795 domain-containing protein [Methanosarcina sp.]|jgi:hypothetical protein|nr:DUF3795 domain-containing protein [Methanosarcina sp.]